MACEPDNSIAAQIILFLCYLSILWKLIPLDHNKWFLDLQCCQWFIVTLGSYSSRCRTADIPKQHIAKGKKIQRRNYGIFSPCSYKQRVKFWALKLVFLWHYLKSNGWCLRVPAFSDYESAFWAVTEEDIEPITCLFKPWTVKAAWCSEQCGEQNSSLVTSFKYASPQDCSCLSLWSGTRSVTSLLPRGQTTSQGTSNTS